MRKFKFTKGITYIFCLGGMFGLFKELYYLFKFLSDLSYPEKDLGDITFLICSGIILLYLRTSFLEESAKKILQYAGFAAIFEGLRHVVYTSFRSFSATVFLYGANIFFIILVIINCFFHLKRLQS